MAATDLDMQHTVVDLETTGLDLAQDRIRSIGAVGGSANHGVFHAMRLLVDAGGRPSHPEALRVHGIPDALAGGLRMVRALQMLEVLRQGGPVVMHNKHYDGPLLRRSYEEAGIAVPDYLLDLGLVTDTVDIGREHYPHAGNSLGAIVRAAGVVPGLLAARTARHDGLEDAIMTFEVWRKHARPVALDLAPRPARKAAMGAASAADPSWQGMDWLAGGGR